MQNFKDGSVILDKPEEIQAYRLLVIRNGLKLECKGMKLSRGTPCSVHARNVLKAAGKAAPANKAKLSEAFAAHLTEIGVLQPVDYRDAEREKEMRMANGE
jgi:hypothetical protein